MSDRKIQDLPQHSNLPNPSDCDEPLFRSIVLRHERTSELREVPCLRALQSKQLEIKWGLAGIYVFDLRSDRLLKAPEWRSVGLETVWHVWNDMLPKSARHVLGIPLREPGWAKKKRK